MSINRLRYWDSWTRRKGWWRTPESTTQRWARSTVACCWYWESSTQKKTGLLTTAVCLPTVNQECESTKSRNICDGVFSMFITKQHAYILTDHRDFWMAAISVTTCLFQVHGTLISSPSCHHHNWLYNTRHLDLQQCITWQWMRFIYHNLWDHSHSPRMLVTSVQKIKETWLNISTVWHCTTLWDFVLMLS